MRVYVVILCDYPELTYREAEVFETREQAEAFEKEKGMEYYTYVLEREVHEKQERKV